MLLRQGSRKKGSYWGEDEGKRKTRKICRKEEEEEE